MILKNTKIRHFAFFRSHFVKKITKKFFKKRLDKRQLKCYTYIIKRKEIQTMKAMKNELRYLADTWREDKGYCIKQAVLILCGVALVVAQTVALVRLF